jgi:hypothetical protein
LTLECGDEGVIKERDLIKKLEKLKALAGGDS